MSDLVLSGLTLLLLGVGAALGRALLRILPPDHRSAETFAFTRTVSSLLVTFTALVLSLLLTTISSDFKKTDNDLRGFAATIIRLDSELEGLGAASRPVRDALRAYAAAMVASTWPEGPRPGGAYPVAVAHGPDFDAPNLGVLLSQGEAQLRSIGATDPAAARLQQRCLVRFEALMDQRWTLVGEAHSSISRPFFAMMLFWLLIVFLSFGLSAPANATAAVFILLAGLSIAGAVFVILELDGPLDGLIKVSSEPMRHALEHLDGIAAPTP